MHSRLAQGQHLGKLSREEKQPPRREDVRMGKATKAPTVWPVVLAVLDHAF